MSVYQNISKAKGAFFDWDGTLVDSFEFLHAAHNYTRGKLGIAPFGLEEFRQYFGQPREKLYSFLYGERMEEAKAHFKEYVVANHIEGLREIEGAKAVLEWFKRVGIPCAVVTNKPAELVAKEITNFGWDEYFVTLVGAGMAQADKPSAAPLELALEKAGLGACHREDILFIGDTDNDLQCAQNAGCLSVFIENIEKYEALLQDNKIDFHFETCEAFYDFLLQSDTNSLKT